MRASGAIDLRLRLMEVSDQRHASIALPPTIVLAYPLKRGLLSPCASLDSVTPTGNQILKSRYPDSALVIILDKPSLLTVLDWIPVNLLTDFLICVPGHPVQITLLLCI